MDEPAPLTRQEEMADTPPATNKMSAFATAPLTPVSASTKVFGIVELVEAILCAGVDMRQLFALQRVNRTFLDTIADSKALSVQMFRQHEYPMTNFALVKMNQMVLHAIGKPEGVSGKDHGFEFGKHDGIFWVNTSCASAGGDECCSCKALNNFPKEPKGLLNETQLLNMPIKFTLVVWITAWPSTWPKEQRFELAKNPSLGQAIAAIIAAHQTTLCQFREYMEILQGSTD